MAHKLAQAVSRAPQGAWMIIGYNPYGCTIQETSAYIGSRGQLMELIFERYREDSPSVYRKLATHLDIGGDLVMVVREVNDDVPYLDYERVMCGPAAQVLDLADLALHLHDTWDGETRAVCGDMLEIVEL